MSVEKTEMALPNRLNDGAKAHLQSLLRFWHDQQAV